MMRSIIVFSLFLCVSLSGSVHTAVDSKSLLIPQEIEGDVLQIEPVEATLEAFFAKGGTLIRMEGDQPPFRFLPGDWVFPACSGGFNRSQTTWALLKPYADRITLMNPHATRYGLDPYNGEVNWHRRDNHRVDEREQEYISWAGHGKATKFGVECFGEFLSRETASDEELDTLRDYYNRAYYAPQVAPNTRRIYISFEKNTHVHLQRLAETNASLENVIVLHFPLPDLIHKPLPELKIVRQSEQAYLYFAQLLLPFFDFSIVQTAP